MGVQEKCDEKKHGRTARLKPSRLWRALGLSTARRRCATQNPPRHNSFRPAANCRSLTSFGMTNLVEMTSLVWDDKL